MDRLSSITDENIGFLVQEKDSDNTKCIGGSIPNLFAGKKAMQIFHFSTTGRVIPV